MLAKKFLENILKIDECLTGFDLIEIMKVSPGQEPVVSYYVCVE